jgi:hypothetical protein
MNLMPYHHFLRPTRQITAYGASSGAAKQNAVAYKPGIGAMVRGLFSFQAGDIISVVVGQPGTFRPSTGASSFGGGGGGRYSPFSLSFLSLINVVTHFTFAPIGGTFVFYNDTSRFPLLVAGGGGGSSCLLSEERVEGGSARKKQDTKKKPEKYNAFHPSPPCTSSRLLLELAVLGPAWPRVFARK